MSWDLIASWVWVANLISCTHGHIFIQSMSQMVLLTWIHWTNQKLNYWPIELSALYCHYEINWSTSFVIRKTIDVGPADVCYWALLKHNHNYTLLTIIIMGVQLLVMLRLWQYLGLTFAISSSCSSPHQLIYSLSSWRQVQTPKVLRQL